MTLVDHLTELRTRLFIVIISVVVAGGVCYLFIEEIVRLVLAPAGTVEFVYLAPPELFLAYLRLSFVLGFLITLPVTLFQIWLFVRPALERSEKRAGRFVLLGGTFFFAAGAFFAYRVILPITLRFFLQYASPAVQPLFSFGGYVGFVLSIVFAFGLAFEMPIVIVIFAKIGLVTPSALRAARKWVYVVIMVLSALLTPPDVVSQVLLAGPMIGLFELSVLAASILARSKSSE